MTLFDIEMEATSRAQIGLQELSKNGIVRHLSKSFKQIKNVSTQFQKKTFP